MKVINNGFTLEMPDDWQDRSMISFAAPQSEAEFVSNIFIVQQKIGSGQNVEDVAREQLEAIEQSGADGFESLGFKSILINGFPSCQMDYRFESDGQRLRQRQVLVLANETIFAFTGTSLESNFRDWHTQFQRVVDSFKVFDTESLII